MKKLLMGALSVALCSAPAFAAPTGYASNGQNQVYSIDLATGSTSLLGSTNLTSGAILEALALSANGSLYGTDSNGWLYSVNTSNGHLTSIGTTGRGNIEGLDFNGNTLLGATFNATPTIFSINPATGSTTTLITAASALPGSPSTMAVESSNVVLLTAGVGASQSLYALDLTTGAVTLRGQLPGFMGGMDFASDGNLYGLRSYFSNGVFKGELYQINPQTGAGTLVGPTIDNFWLGLATPSGSDVPEPASMALMGSGFVAMAALRLRRWK